MSRVLIIGGGIGGLTAALAFHQKGWDVAVYEAAPELRPVGKGIWVPANAMQVLNKLGLAASVAEAGCPLDTIQLRTKSGTVLSTFDLGPVKTQYGHTTISIHRAALIGILSAGLPAGTLHLGKRFSRFESSPDQVVAYFEDGSQAAGDLLVGADGIRSVVREQLFPGVQFRYSGQTCYRGISEMKLPSAVVQHMLGSVGRALSLRLFIHRARPGVLVRSGKRFGGWNRPDERTRGQVGGLVRRLPESDSGNHRSQQHN